MSAAAPPSPVPPARRRIPALDVARTVALICMAIYHFTVDLALFGVVAPDRPFTGLFHWFAATIAGSFLFLSGVSLSLAHDPALRWRPWAKRLAQVAAGAALVSAATYADNPDNYVFFGILHMIAAASIIGLAFLRTPVWLTLAAAALAFAAPQHLRSSAFDAPWLLWLGLSPQIPRSIDFEPVFPWIAPLPAWPRRRPCGPCATAGHTPRPRPHGAAAVMAGATQPCHLSDPPAPAFWPDLALVQVRLRVDLASFPCTGHPDLHPILVAKCRQYSDRQRTGSLSQEGPPLLF